MVCIIGVCVFFFKAETGYGVMLGLVGSGVGFRGRGGGDES